tara:strand:- start:1823 stop:2422 length:600 start_codon:yes stop_codon:yes gene_type:complete
MFSKDLFANIFFVLIIVLFIYNYYVNRDDIQLKCIISKKDGKEYCVRKRSDLNSAVDLLSNTINSLEELKNYINEKYPNDDRVKRINAKFNKTKIKETLPTSKFKAYSENKGETLAFCLNTENENNEELMDKHTLLFVAIHELAHIATVSIGHKEEFWTNFKWLLVNAKQAGIHEPFDYKKKPKKFCGMNVTDNPYYDK